METRAVNKAKTGVQLARLTRHLPKSFTSGISKNISLRYLHTKGERVMIYGPSLQHGMCVRWVGEFENAAKMALR